MAASLCQYYAFREDQDAAADNGCFFKLAPTTPTMDTYVMFKLWANDYIVWPVRQLRRCTVVGLLASVGCSGCETPTASSMHVIRLCGRITLTHTARVAGCRPRQTSTQRLMSSSSLMLTGWTRVILGPAMTPATHSHPAWQYSSLAAPMAGRATVWTGTTPPPVLLRAQSRQTHSSSMRSHGARMLASTMLYTAERPPACRPVLF